MRICAGATSGGARSGNPGTRPTVQCDYRDILLLYYPDTASTYSRTVIVRLVVVGANNIYNNIMLLLSAFILT